MPSLNRDSIRDALELVAGIALALAIRPVRLITRRPAEARCHILVVGPGSGSVGDQAMFEAFANNVSGNVVVLMRDATVLTNGNTRQPDGSSFIEMPSLLYGNLPNFLKDLVRTLILTIKSDTVSVVGADVMDGAYSRRASIRRFQVPFILSFAGLDARVLGFSWNESPPEDVTRKMRAVSKRVALYARDPLSAERLRANGGLNVHMVADLAFLVQGDPAAIEQQDGLELWLREQRQAKRTVAIVNLSSTLAGKFDQLGLFVPLIAGKLDNNFAFILLPHDSRGDQSDEKLAAIAHEMLDFDPRVFVVNHIVPPAHVAGIASKADFVLTGRMHLAILSATACTPSLSISYQGKVEGLYRMLELEHFTDPKTLDAHELDKAFDALAEDHATARTVLERTTEHAKRLARLNVPQ
ncbi:polysaccharide pyruvyl transferase family protein [Rhodococcus sp. IEGM 1381]|uniref:polysaccharide pyruvyl transferase family protein n=1 Tax=Rhodococcus sp. IEGM 1381 TaxID=3047085 RepID=UPI0024B7964F|nr:polysaccharide pyruvyl transferase family protein [Rhodococcus sp. IEGM 1381]MDI9894218.1 polysaccharide pyruvyl transferase family protein [Rhodococcus sp. IEGM 1381]